MLALAVGAFSVRAWADELGAEQIDQPQVGLQAGLWDGRNRTS